jgi:ribose 5-phosphate isomerase B
MKPFDLITESDARMLEIGSTVQLARGGMVTPLARETLKARRVTVVSDDRAEGSIDGLAPVADIRSVAIASDHTGQTLKRALIVHLRGQGRQVVDCGTDGSEPVDYPDVAAGVARAVSRREADAGIVIDGAGIGSAIAANKIDGIRAAMCLNTTMARYAREHNGTNVMTLGATLLSHEEAIAIVNVWLTTPMREARYIRRLDKIRQLERQHR